MRSPTILGVSHLVLSTRDIEEDGRRLAAHGYGVAKRARGIANPAAKAPFCGRPLAPTFDMDLLTAPNLPPVELLHDHGPTSGGLPAYTLALEAPPDLTCACASPDEAAALWAAMGLPATDGKVIIPASAVGASLRVCFETAPARPTTLDQPGWVCLSLLCTNADRLREHLVGAGFAPGKCFTVAPFGQPLRVFFLRNRSGELYEFLSLAPRA